MLQLPSGLQQKRKREDTSRESFGDSTPDSRFQGPFEPSDPGDGMQDDVLAEEDLEIQSYASSSESEFMRTPPRSRDRMGLSPASQSKRSSDQREGNLPRSQSSESSVDSDFMMPFFGNS